MCATSELYNIIWRYIRTTYKNILVDVLEKATNSTNHCNIPCRRKTLQAVEIFRLQSLAAMAS